MTQLGISSDCAMSVTQLSSSSDGAMSVTQLSSSSDGAMSVTQLSSSSDGAMPHDHICSATTERAQSGMAVQWQYDYFLAQRHNSCIYSYSKYDAYPWVCCLMYDYTT